MGCCNQGPLYFVSSIFLILGGAGIVFGFASGFWVPSIADYGRSLWLDCPRDDMTDCRIIDLEDAGTVWIIQLTLLCAGVFFAIMAFIVMFIMCCCCEYRGGLMFTLKFFFMLGSGMCAGACVIWFALKPFGGDQVWTSWDTFTAHPELQYGYYVECAGAGIMLLGSIFALMGRCCCVHNDSFEVTQDGVPMTSYSPGLYYGAVNP